MLASRRHRRVLALLGLLVIPFGAAACASPPRPAVAVGPCGLVVGDAYGDANMQPPYEVHMIFRPSGDEARLDVTGTGWGATRFSMSGPGQALDRMVGDGTDDGGNINDPGSYIMPAVGTWHFRFADDHCIREFDVEVLPKV